MSSFMVSVPNSPPYITYDCVFLMLFDGITKTLEGNTINYKMFSYLQFLRLISSSRPSLACDGIFFSILALVAFEVSGNLSSKA